MQKKRKGKRKKMELDAAKKGKEKTEKIDVWIGSR